MEVIPNAVEMKQSKCEKKGKYWEERLKKHFPRTVFFQGLAQTRKLLTENIHVINPTFHTCNNEIWVQEEKYINGVKSIYET